jgi:hypothetical protein
MSSASQLQLQVKVPKDSKGGQQIQVNHQGQLFNVTVPPGLAPGDDFMCVVPVSTASGPVVVQGTPVAGGAPPGYGYAAAPGPMGKDGSELPPCRDCGRHFTRPPGTSTMSAQYFRCQECQGVSLPCLVM